MKLFIDQSTLSKALSAVSRAVSSRSTLPVLAYIHLDAKDTSLRLDATNLEIGLSAWADADIQAPGAVCAPARPLADLVSTLPPGPVSLTLDAKNTLTVKGGKSKANLKCMDASEFPPMPEPSENTFTLAAASLRNAISQVVFAASTDEGRPTLTGVLIEGNANGLTLAAADGFRLAVCKLDMPCDLKAIVPAKAMGELAKMPGDTIEVFSGRGQIIFTSGNIRLASQIIDGTYPLYDQIIPKAYMITAVVETAALLHAVKQAEIFARDAANVVRLSFSENCVEVTGRSAETGDHAGSVDADFSGDAITIGLNGKYAADILGVIKSEKVQIRMNNPNAAVTFTPVDGPDLTIVQMPMHLNA